MADREIQNKAKHFARQVLSKHTFKISRQKGSDFFAKYHFNLIVEYYGYFLESPMGGEVWKQYLKRWKTLVFWVRESGDDELDMRWKSPRKPRKPACAV